MDKRLLMVFGFALVIALIVVLIFYRILSGRMAAEPKVVQSQVLVASRDLAVGTSIQDSDVGFGPWAGPVPPNAITKKEDLVGRGVLSTIYQGEPVLENRLAQRGAGGGLASTIPSGMRAVAVRVNEIIGLAGFVVPGLRVDVLIAGTAPGTPTNAGTLSKTLLQNIEVLSAGQNLQRDRDGKPIPAQVVTLLVTPDQAETLSLASTETKIQLVLRNPLDTAVVKTSGTAVSTLFSGQKYGVETAAPKPRVRVAAPAVVVPQVKEKPPVVVEVIQGPVRNSVKFEER